MSSDFPCDTILRLFLYTAKILSKITFSFSEGVTVFLVPEAQSLCIVLLSTICSILFSKTSVPKIKPFCLLSGSLQIDLFFAQANRNLMVKLNIQTP